MTTKELRASALRGIAAKTGELEEGDRIYLQALAKCLEKEPEPNEDVTQLLEKIGRKRSVLSVGLGLVKGNRTELRWRASASFKDRTRGIGIQYGSTPIEAAKNLLKELEK